MAGKGDVKAGGAFIRLFLKDDLTSTLRRTLKTTAAVVAPIGGAIAAGLSAAMANFTKIGSDVNDMAARTGVGAAKLQELSFAVKQTGASAEDLEKAMRTMARNGFDVNRFEEIGQSIAAIRDPSERAARAMEVFGKSGTNLLPMLADLNSLRSQSRALGPILTDEEVALADSIGDSFGALTEAVSRAMNQIAVSFGPQLKTVLDSTVGAVVKASRLLSEMNEFGRGGDWLDKAAEFLRTPWSEFGKIGAAGTASVAGGGRAAAFGGGDDAEKSTDRVSNKWDDVMRKINRAHEARNALIAQFDTPAEKFLKKQQEINQAMAALQRNRALGFVSEGDAKAQQQGLRNAMLRLNNEEMMRRQAMMRRPEAAGKAPMEAKAEIVRSAVSATSAAGAVALGFGGGAGVATKTLDEIRALKKIAADQLRIQREAAARRERPGIFKA